MNAPERIWAFYAPEIADDNNGATIVAHEAVQHGGQPYFRADLFAATLARAEHAEAANRGLVRLNEATEARAERAEALLARAYELGRDDAAKAVYEAGRMTHGHLAAIGSIVPPDDLAARLEAQP